MKPIKLHCELETDDICVVRNNLIKYDLFLHLDQYCLYSLRKLFIFNNI